MPTTTQDKRVARRLAQLRLLILKTAAQLGEVGELQETTRWGQPSFLPSQPRIGTTIRMDVFDEDHVALFVHCQTDLISTFRTLFPEMQYSANRAMLVPLTGKLPTDIVQMFVEAAFTYHLRKRKKTG